MCIDCLNNVVEVIDRYENDMCEFKKAVTCECCIDYLTFLLGVNQDLKVLCCVKIKQHTCDTNELKKITHFEEMVRLRIKNRLNFGLEKIEDSKEGMKNGDYLVKMNQLKSMHDLIKDIDNANHN